MTMTEKEFEQQIKLFFSEFKKEMLKNSQWIVVQKQEFLNMLLLAKGKDSAETISQYKKILDSKRQRNIDYPAAFRFCGNTYSLIPYKKLEMYAESGKVRFVKHNKPELLMMRFI